jgi:spore coat protein JB
LNPEKGAVSSVCGDNSGTMPACAPLAVPYVPYQQENPKRYSQADALNNGTLYPGLNLPFHVRATAANLPQTPLTELQALEFVNQELALYLDTHPSDTEAFELFKKYTALEREAHASYTATGHPISRGDSADAKTYTWMDDPWPWNYPEGGMR